MQNRKLKNGCSWINLNIILFPRICSWINSNVTIAACCDGILARTKSAMRIRFVVIFGERDNNKRFSHQSRFLHLFHHGSKKTKQMKKINDFVNWRDSIDSDHSFNSWKCISGQSYRLFQLLFRLHKNEQRSFVVVSEREKHSDHLKPFRIRLYGQNV